MDVRKPAYMDVPGRAALQRYREASPFPGYVVASNSSIPADASDDLERNIVVEIFGGRRGEVIRRAGIAAGRTTG